MDHITGILYTCITEPTPRRIEMPIEIDFSNIKVTTSDGISITSHIPSEHALQRENPSKKTELAIKMY